MGEYVNFKFRLFHTFVNKQNSLINLRVKRGKKSTDLDEKDASMFSTKKYIYIYNFINLRQHRKVK